jgi:hypothetical protein
LSYTFRATSHSADVAIDKPGAGCGFGSASLVPEVVSGVRKRGTKQCGKQCGGLLGLGVLKLHFESFISLQGQFQFKM